MSTLKRFLSMCTKKFMYIFVFAALFAGQSLWANYNKPVIAVISVPKGMLCSNEIGYLTNLGEVFDTIGADAKAIYADKVINTAKNAIMDDILQNDTTQNNLLSSIEDYFNQLILNENLTGILIPGCCNDMITEWSKPENQVFVQAVINTISNHENIHLVAMSGVFYSIMHIQGIEVVPNSNIKQNNPLSLQKPFHSARIVPGTALAEIAEKFSSPADENGWYKSSFYNMYGWTIRNSKENIAKIELLGYAISAFSNDGTIEVLEDKHGNILFHGCPEFILTNTDTVEKSHTPEAVFASKIVAALFKRFLHNSN